MEKLKVVIAADSFKGSASSKEVAEHIEKGIKKYDDEISVKKVCIADGGEGTVEAIVEGADTGEYQFVQVHGPLGNLVNARYGIMQGAEGNKIAVMEMAEASGINLITKEERNPFETSTFGVGEMFKKVLDMGIREIYIGLGGSATNDGGAGMLASLGAKFYNAEGREIGYTPKELKNIAKIDFSEFDKRISETKISILSDVRNELCGETGASYIFGAQKGATPEGIKELDSILRKYGDIIDDLTGKKYSQMQGSGAAGGLGFALLSVCKGEFKEGIVEVMNLINLENTIKGADLVITGEGRIDNQSVFGKAPVGVAKMAKKFDIPVIAVVGSSARNLDDIYKNGIDLVLDIVHEPMSLEKAMAETGELLEFAGEKAIRAFFLGK